VTGHYVGYLYRPRLFDCHRANIKSAAGSRLSGNKYCYDDLGGRINHGWVEGYLYILAGAKSNPNPMSQSETAGRNKYSPRWQAS